MIPLRIALALGIALQAAAGVRAQGAPDVPAGPEVASGPAVMLRGLDKVSGQITDLEIATGSSGRYGPFEVSVSDCRYPVDDPTSNAYAHLSVRDPAREAPVFDGWMIASSPALSALDHPRYDLWVLRCKSN